MSELPNELIELPDCTPLQRELFRESVRRGRPLALVHLEPSVADALRSPTAMLEELGDTGRELLLTEWSSHDEESGFEDRWDLAEHAARLPPRWSSLLPDLVQRDRAGVEVGDAGLARLIRSLAVRGASPAARRPLPAALAALNNIAEEQREEWLVAVGVGLVATGRELLGVRRTARLMLAARDSERWAADSVERVGFEPSDEWCERYRELLVALADHEPRERFKRMGAYVVAMASSRELGGLVDSSDASALSPELWALVHSYADSVRRSSRRGLSSEASAFLEVIQETDNV